MRPSLREFVPSMFQRRLLLLLSTALLIVCGLAYQMTRLTIAQGSQNRKLAEEALTEGNLIPTIRGKIYDRTGKRVLAQDQASYDIAVQYAVIDGDWAYERAKHHAYVDNKARWAELDFSVKEELISGYQPPFNAQVEALWNTLCSLGHIDRAELADRITTVKSRVYQIASYVEMREHTSGLTDTDDPEPLRKAAQAIQEQGEAHALLTNVDDPAMIAVRTLINKAEQPSDIKSDPDPADDVWNQVSIQDSHQRDYPMETVDLQLNRIGLPSPLRAEDPLPVHVEGVGMHILGLMRLVDATAVHDRPFVRGDAVTDDPDMGGYLSGDKVGSWGIERAQEEWLRGRRGQVVVRKDTDDETTTPPIPGNPVVLTIDILLQARIQAMMDPSFGLLKVQSWQGKDPTVTSLDQPYRPVVGDVLNGAAVVIDVATDQVLAAVSAPTLSLRRLRTDPNSVINDKINEPFVNRVVDRAYQPGSTVKPLVLAAAITDHKLGYDETITCNGFMDAGHADRFRCWIFREYQKVHGPLTGPEAIEHSCNIFFFTMGQRLGVRRIVQWYQTYGLGHPLGCGLEDEVGGSLPNLARATAQDLGESNARFLGIGQGPINWTPLQAANAYAALARGGKPRTPTYVVTPAQPPQQPPDLGLDPRGVEEALEGLDMVVNEHGGTGNHLTQLGEKIFNCPGVHVRGKSGTADAHPLVIEDKGVKRTVREGSHGWFIGLVNKEGESTPRYAIAVIVEYGGSGGNVAGPVANQIIYALRDEGYL